MAYLTVHDVGEKLSKYSPCIRSKYLTHYFTSLLAGFGIDLSYDLSWRVRRVHLHARPVASRDIPTDSLVTETGHFFFFFIRCHAHRNPSLIFSIDFLPPFLSRLFSLLFSVLFFHLSFVCFFFFYFNSKIGTLFVIVWPRSYFSFLSCPLFFFFFPSLFTFYRSSRFNAS